MSKNAARKFINDLMASLYIDNDDDDNVPNTAAATSTMVGTSTNSSLAGPSPFEIDNVWKTVYNSFKIIAVANCPVPAHQHLRFCGCPSGMSPLTTRQTYNIKVNSFIRNWDTILLNRAVGA